MQCSFIYRYYYYECGTKDSSNYVTVPCKSDKRLCIRPDEVCDGIPHCPGGTDEDLNDCEQYFPTSATLNCTKPGNIGNNITIQIKATICNGIKECSNGEDELECIDKTLITGVTVLFTLVFMLAISTCVIGSMNLHTYSPLNYLQNLTNFELMHQIITQDHGKQASIELYQRFLRLYECKATALNKLKV